MQLLIKVVGHLESLSSFQGFLGHLHFHLFSFDTSVKVKQPFSTRVSPLGIFARDEFMGESGCTLFNFCFRCISKRY